MSYMSELMIKRLNKEREEEIKKEMKEEYEFQCWTESIEYFELTRGR